jgi:hypothetical protein
MTVYSLILFTHVVATLFMVAALTIEAVVLSNLRPAENTTTPRSWLDLWPVVQVIAIASLLALLVSGGYLVERSSGWKIAWPKVAVGILAIIAVLGAISGARLREIRRSGLKAHAQLVFLILSSRIRIALSLAAVWLMTARPGLMESLSISGAAVLCGFATAAASRRLRQSSSRGSRVHVR